MEPGLSAAPSFDGVFDDFVRCTCRGTRFGPLALCPADDSSGQFGHVDHAEVSAQPHWDRSRGHDGCPETLESQRRKQAHTVDLGESVQDNTVAECCAVDDLAQRG